MRESLFRPVITVVRRAPDDRVMEVALDLDGWITDGEAEVRDGDLLTAAAEAACLAVTALLPDWVEARLDRVHQVQQGPWPRPVVLSTVNLVVDGTDAGEPLLGSAFVHTDAQVAAVRATLDALTRRLARYVED